MINFVRVERPAITSYSSYQGLRAAVFATLTSGDAVSVPLDGESYSPLRNRVNAHVAKVARLSNARVRTTLSDDQLSMIVWLEPKDDGARERVAVSEPDEQLMNVGALA